MMKQAQKMQKDMAATQASLADKTVEATAGGGKITVTATAAGDITGIRIDPSVVDPSDVEMLEDLILSGVQKAIEEATGFRPRWFRAPVGHRNWFTHPVAGMLGLRVMGWNRRGYDAVATDASKVLDRILPDLTAGDIILLHEATPIAAEVLAEVLGHCSNKLCDIPLHDAGGV